MPIFNIDGQIKIPWSKEDVSFLNEYFGKAEQKTKLSLKKAKSVKLMTELNKDRDIYTLFINDTDTREYVIEKFSKRLNNIKILRNIMPSSKSTLPTTTIISKDDCYNMWYFFTLEFLSIRSKYSDIISPHVTITSDSKFKKDHRDLNAKHVARRSKLKSASGLITLSAKFSAFGQKFK
jgi:hypothetical protein